MRKLYYIIFDKGLYPCVLISGVARMIALKGFGWRNLLYQSYIPFNLNIQNMIIHNNFIIVYIFDEEFSGMKSTRIDLFLVLIHLRSRILIPVTGLYIFVLIIKLLFKIQIY